MLKIYLIMITWHVFFLTSVIVVESQNHQIMAQEHNQEMMTQEHSQQHSQQEGHQMMPQQMHPVLSQEQLPEQIMSNQQFRKQTMPQQELQNQIMSQQKFPTKMVPQEEFQQQMMPQQPMISQQQGHKLSMPVSACSGQLCNGPMYKEDSCCVNHICVPAQPDSNSLVCMDSKAWTKVNDYQEIQRSVRSG